MTDKLAPVPAPLPAGASSGSGSVLPWLKGQLAWLVYQGIGLVVGLPVVVKLLVQLVTRWVPGADRSDHWAPVGRCYLWLSIGLGHAASFRAVPCWRGKEPSCIGAGRCCSQRPAGCLPRACLADQRVCWHVNFCAHQTRHACPPAPRVLPSCPPACSPRQTLHRKDRNQIEYPDPLPGLKHEWIETTPDVKWVLHASLSTALSAASAPASAAPVRALRATPCQLAVCASRVGGAPGAPQLPLRP